MMNTNLSPHLYPHKVITDVAKSAMAVQNSGILKAYFETAKQLCQRYRIPVCDRYARWEALYAAGVQVTELLANQINHPIRELNRLTAYELVKLMIESE